MRLHDRYIVSIVVIVAAAVGLVTPAHAQSASVPGVTPTSVKVCYIFAQTGVASSGYTEAGNAFKARIDRENAKGGVIGRKIDAVVIDDGSANNLNAAHDCVQSRNVFAVAQNSSLAFLSYRYLEGEGVPVIGSGADGNEYGVAGNENLISIFGNVSPSIGAQYTSAGKVLKAFGAKSAGAVGYSISPSSTAAAKGFVQYAAKQAGVKGGYLNTSVDFGSTDVGPLVLGMKNAGIDSLYLPLVPSTNFAILRAAQQNALDFKVAILATGYGQALLHDLASSSLDAHDLMALQYAPVELKTAATKQLQADLKKESGYTGAPEYGQYTGYLIGDLLIDGLKAAGKNLTRQGFIDATKNLKTWNGAGLTCQPVDVSRENFGKAPANGCGWYVYVKDGKFVVYNNGKPVTGKLIEASTGAPTSTTTTAPAP